MHFRRIYKKALVHFVQYAHGTAKALMESCKNVRFLLKNGIRKTKKDRLSAIFSLSIID